VAVTRGEFGDGPLTRLLLDRGARVLDWGTITFGPPDDLDPLLSALARISDYDWICFSSPRAVDAVVSRVESAPDGVWMAAVGPSTAAAMTEASWPVHRVPAGGTGEGLVEAFAAAGDAQGTMILFPASAVARDVIPDGLMALGAHVDRVHAYQLVTLPLDASSCQASMDAGELQVILFASPSALRGVKRNLGETLFRRLVEGVPAAAMGPTTAAALHGVGWRAVSVADEPTFEALIAAAERAVAT
jgi:uroporphyrinogen-III synthase